MRYRQPISIKRLTQRSAIYFILFTCLIISTINLLLPHSSCTTINSVHSNIIYILSKLEQSSIGSASIDQPIHPDLSLKPLLLTLLKQSTKYQRLLYFNHEKYASKSCKLSSIHSLSKLRRKLEFSLSSKYSTDGILLYLLCILGINNKIFIEIDHSLNYKFIGIASLFSNVLNWTGYGFYENWSSFESARVFYLNNKQVNVIDSNRLFNSKINTYNFGGKIDFLAIFPGGGDELLFVNSFSSSTYWLRPKIFLCFYQDYWGYDVNKVRVSRNSSQLIGKRNPADHYKQSLFVGASLNALTRIANKNNYTLVWCMSSQPIAIFLDQKQDDFHIHSLLLPTISAQDCLKHRQIHGGITWLRDMEAMWDDAQSYKWTSSSSL